MAKLSPKKRVIKLAGIQCGPYEGSYIAQMEKLTALFELAAQMEKPHAVCFSELMTTPYIGVKYDRKLFDLAETRGGRTIAHFKKLALAHKTAVIGTFFEKAGAKYYNSAFVINAKGGLAGIYRKTHIPIVNAPDLKTNEKIFFTPGGSLPVFDLGFAKAGVLICYDRLFPESARVLKLKGAEMIFICVASCGFRGEQFLEEIRVRAMENACFVAGINKAGAEKTGGLAYKHFGLSNIADPFGRTVIKAGDKPWSYITAELDLSDIKKASERWDILSDRRPDLYGELTRNRT